MIATGSDWGARDEGYFPILNEELFGTFSNPQNHRVVFVEGQPPTTASQLKCLQLKGKGKFPQDYYLQRKVPFLGLGAL